MTVIIEVPLFTGILMPNHPKLCAAIKADNCCLPNSCLWRNILGAAISYRRESPNMVLSHATELKLQADEYDCGLWSLLGRICSSRTIRMLNSEGLPTKKSGFRSVSSTKSMCVDLQIIPNLCVSRCPESNQVCGLTQLTMGFCCWRALATIACIT